MNAQILSENQKECYPWLQGGSQDGAEMSRAEEILFHDRKTAIKMTGRPILGVRSDSGASILSRSRRISENIG
jgi:hypothetical protein